MRDSLESAGWLERLAGRIECPDARTGRKEPDDLDSPWKEMLEHFLESFLALCFPRVHAAIDWARGYRSLDKELQQIARDAAVRKRLADKLFKVWANTARRPGYSFTSRCKASANPDLRSECSSTTTGFVTDTIARS